MFSLFALQIALTRFWMQFFAGFAAFHPAGCGHSPAEQKAAAQATLELERIVRAHSSTRRQGAEND
nr:hypothetical protein [uncultured Rhodopila sp.]